MKNKRYILLIIIIAISSFFLFSKFYQEEKDNVKSKGVLTLEKEKQPGNIEGSSTTLETPTPGQDLTLEMQIDKNKTYDAILKTTEGDITINLNAKDTPITVNNFVTLARKNFYDNTIFHRVIKGFMIQGGDPKGDGTGGPGYTFADEPFLGSYERGVVAMANAGPNTNGSQFFIMHKDYVNLPRNYVIFGKVIKGIEVVDKIAEASVSASPIGEMSKPVKPVTVQSVEIIEQ